MTSKPADQDAKQQQLEPLLEDGSDQYLTTNTGVRVSDNHNSLKAGPRGPTLIEDFVLREKINHFDHERIPERIVHARGTGAFGYFECTDPIPELTRAKFLGEKGKRTPLLVRFSTVAGSRGSSDTPRDVRGFAVKFYTDQGNYDLVGNNIPVFFIHDAMKFPDLVHAAKPEPDRDFPQAATAHDTFWDFISLMPESMHMVMWIMSDRTLPRSLRMMEGFGVHTFRLINAEGKAHFVKFHWKPVLGSHALTWDESSLLYGKDPDVHKRDLWNAIEQGNFPEWELGVQVIPEEDEMNFSFDLLDATKLVPEELVPVRRVGRMVLNRNPDNSFAEIEQVAFNPGHVVDGIDFTNDPLLQGRLFSYLDTQMIRLGGPNFQEIPVNRPVAPVHNNQRDGYGRQMINKGRVAYEPNTLGRGCPMHAPQNMGGYVHHAEKIDAHKVRARSQSFNDHFSQAQLFFRSQAPAEQQHIIDALSFELSKVETREIRERMIGLLTHVDQGLAQKVADKIGMAAKPVPVPPNAADPKNNIVPPHQATAIAQQDDKQVPQGKKPLPQQSKALSMVLTNPGTLKTRVYALLVADGVDGAHVDALQKALEAEGAKGEIVAPKLGAVKTADGKSVEATKHLESTPSLVYDGVILPGGKASVDALAASGTALLFVAQSFKHLKPIAAVGDAHALLDAAPLGGFKLPAGQGVQRQQGVVAGAAAADVGKAFVEEAKKHRHWDRPVKSVPV